MFADDFVGIPETCQILQKYLVDYGEGTINRKM